MNFFRKICTFLAQMTVFLYFFSKLLGCTNNYRYLCRRISYNNTISDFYYEVYNAHTYFNISHVMWNN